MKYIYSTIGQNHIDHNEDYALIEELDHIVILAVMDGCSSGKESYFASNLIGKIIKKAIKEISYVEFVEKKKFDLNIILEMLINKLFLELKNIKGQLLLDKYELLSTLLIGILDKEQKNAIIQSIGDGLICVNGEYYEFDHGDKPDYIAYHLEEEFDEWYIKQKQKINFRNVKSISLSSDGIFTFKKFDNQKYKSIPDQEIIQSLMNDFDKSNEYYLKAKMVEIEQVYGLKTLDDLSIVGLVLDY